MKSKVRILIGIVALSVGALLPGMIAAQNPQPPPRSSQTSARAAAYETAKEVIVVGTVVSYSESSMSRPNGTHVLVKTPNGNIDVHLGPASYLRANNFSLAAGDSVRFVGAISSTESGSVLLARIAQKGSQALAIRSTKGFLLAAGAPRTLPQAQRAQSTQNGSAR
ncbi:MAG TPA: hypothetical protein VMT75_11560 [Candidatus Saccharimonadales bacterium]|nr:hypothetical protein [Candidatus Saccharimonadales bacterium]